MNVTTIEMSRFDARRKWEEYRRVVADRKTPEDEALRKAYRELALGKRVLSLHQVLSAAGRDDKFRPKLAVARCHWEHCFFLYDGMQPTFSYDRSSYYERGDWRRRIRLGVETFGPPLQSDMRSRTCLKAVVPRVPPSLRPRAHLERYAVLWEAEWETVVRDPILLKPLGHDLYLVCAQWDLTELERAILFHQ
jgi:hypothetical protein